MPTSCVIPAPLASEASKRDQAGTHAPDSLLLVPTMGVRWRRAPEFASTRALKVDWVPAWSRDDLSGPRSAGATLARVGRDR
jgi:hypothetical protein